MGVKSVFLAAVLWCVAGFGAMAQTLIRDAEIEHALGRVAQPILQAAGLPASTRILLIKNNKPNAFVIDSQAIYLHTGLISMLDDAAQLQSVIAHEAAHIANGHLSRRAANIGAAGNAAKVGLALAALAAAAGGGADAGIGIAAGTASAASRRFLAHTRAEEASADQSALRYMRAAGVDPSAKAEVLRKFLGQEALSSSRQDPYVRSHPLSRDRIRAVEGYAAGVTPRQVDRRAVEYWYARARAKLDAFTKSPASTIRKVRGRDDELGLMMQAVAYHRRPDPKRATQALNKLLALRGNDPFYNELRGQILLESRQPQAAVAAYRRAAQLAPREPLIAAGLGRALLAAKQNAEALKVLSTARARAPSDPNLLRDLSIAHARAGQNGLAAVASAERLAVIGKLKDAGLLARRAMGLLPRGSRGWLRAQDVASAAERAAKR